jgi:hypothetical protein
MDRGQYREAAGAITQRLSAGRVSRNRESDQRLLQQLQGDVDCNAQTKAEQKSE